MRCRMLNKKVLNFLLNVKHTVVDDVKIFDDDSVVFYVHPTKGEQCRCGICGRKAPYYDAGRGARLWRATDIGLHKAEICADSYRVNCPEHGVVVAAVPWARHNSRYTRDFEQTAAWLAMNCSKTAVSQFMRMSWNSIGPVISRIRADLDFCPESRFDGLEKIGIDETSYRKGHKYMTVVVNHDTGRVVWAAPGHGKEVLAKFFEQLSEEQRAAIRLVSADGAKWIASCVEEYCPNAARCIDPFHVVEWANEALSRVRIESWHDAKKKAAPEQKRKPGRPPKGTPAKNSAASEIKGAKYALGKNPEHLTANQQAKLELIAKTDSRLWRAYKLKEELRTVFRLDRETGQEQLDHWIRWAQHCRIPAFVELQRKIRRHYDAILATLESGLSNARIEAVNNKIKLSIRMAYGFRNTGNMIDMIMLRCSDLTVPLPWEW